MQGEIFPMRKLIRSYPGRKKRRKNEKEEWSCGLNHKEKMRKKNGRIEIEMGYIVQRIEQLELEMAHLRKNRRNALKVLKRAEKFRKAEKG
jgi:predicted nuclease with TOPRIM domain